MEHDLKVHILNDVKKHFIQMVKLANGKGPPNIYVNCHEGTLSVVMEGIVTNFERYLINNFDNEAIVVLTDFYKRAAKIEETALKNRITELHSWHFCKLTCDFHKDYFVYIMEYVEDKVR